jgi:hypothetical protein
MIYIRFPHPDLDANGDLVAFRAKTSYADKDWLNLMPWLEAHQYVATHRQGGGKCWYSEQPIAGKGDREVEHFRPKMTLSPLNAKQKAQLRKRKIHDEILPYLDEAGSGYPWLRFEPRNYRLSSASVNRQGSKGSVFPVLRGTARLADPTVDDAAEYAILLDPCKKEDVLCLTVNLLGEIEPAYDARLDATTDLAAQWTTDAMRWLRARVSMLVYDLNHPSWIKCRKQVYELAIQDIAELTAAIASGNDPLLGKCKDVLIARSQIDAPFASAARAAIAHQIAARASSSSKADQLSAAVLQAIENFLARAEGFA